MAGARYESSRQKLTMQDGNRYAEGRRAETLQTLSRCLSSIDKSVAAIRDIVTSRELPIALENVDMAAALTMIGAITGELRRHLPPCAYYQRDTEVAAILREIRQRLHQLNGVRGRSRDEMYASIEAFAAPYALAFYYEIALLDSQEQP